MRSPLVTRRLSPAAAIAAGLAVSTAGFLPAALVHGPVALGGTVGITVFGTIAAAVYHSQLHDAPAEARESA
jgi:hypothetical protein